ncbi:MAG: LamG domain-containing protein [Phycisphaerae bacterium]|jgi:hypothetical protein
MRLHRDRLWSSMLPILALGVSVPTAIGQQPLLHYDFEDQTSPTANLGSLGPSQNGNLLGDPEYTSFGGGFALQFDGAGDHVIPMGSESDFDIGDGDFTLAATIQTSYSDTVPASNLVITKENAGSDPTYALAVRRDTGLVRFFIADGSSNVIIDSTTIVNDGVPHRLVGIREGDQLLLFVDGIEEAMVSIPETFGSTNNNANLVIGGRTVAVIDPGDFHGIIDDVRVYSEAVRPPSVPSVSAWGLVALACLILITGTIVYARRLPAYSQSSLP